MNINTQRFSYDEYTRYLHNLNCVYGRINRKAEVHASIVDMGKGRRQHILNVSIGGILQQLSDSQGKILRDLSEECSCLNERSWILLDTTLDVTYLSTFLPKWWINDILPYIINNDEYIKNGFLYWNASINERVCLYAEERICDFRYYEILKQLVSMYKRGSIVTSDRNFVDKWQLKADNYDGTGLKTIYHPTWWNTLLTRDPTKYLYDALESTGIGHRLMSITHDKPMPSSYTEALMLIYDEGRYANILNFMYP